MERMEKMEGQMRWYLGRVSVGKGSKIGCGEGAAMYRS